MSQTSTQPQSLPDSFVDAFAVAVHSYSRPFARSIARDDMRRLAERFWVGMTEAMTPAEVEALTASEFGDLASAGFVAAELSLAGIPLDAMESAADVRRAIKSKQFRWHLRERRRRAGTHRRLAGAEIERLEAEISRREREIEATQRSQEWAGADKARLEAELAAGQRREQELASRLRWAETEWPAQAQRDLEKAQAEHDAAVEDMRRHGELD